MSYTHALPFQVMTCPACVGLPRLAVLMLASGSFSVVPPPPPALFSPKALRNELVHAPVLISMLVMLRVVRVMTCVVSSSTSTCEGVSFGDITMAVVDTGVHVLPPLLDVSTFSVPFTVNSVLKNALLT